MDFYLLKLVGEWLSVLFVSLVAFFGAGNYQEKHYDAENTNYTKTVAVVKEVIPYTTRFVYNPNKPATSEEIILVEGEDGLSYRFENGVSEVLRAPVSKVVEVGTQGAQFVGRLTSYAGDCRGCSRTATVACRTREGRTHSLFRDGKHYIDREYGEVRILAADLRGFSCGTMILVDNGRTEPFMAVVLDTGGTMRQSFRRGHIWMDLAYEYERDIFSSRRLDSKNTTYTIQRWGW